MRKIRVLHVISRFTAGGVEKWLVDLDSTLSTSDQIELDYWCISGKRADWDEFVSGKIYYSPNIERGKIRFLLSIASGEISFQSYDIVHLHLYRFSSIMAVFLKYAGARRIVVHSHNDKRSLERSLRLPKKILSKVYGWLSKFLFNILKPYKVGASNDAIQDLFGNRHFPPIPERIFCGVKVKNHLSKEKEAELREEFSLQKNTPCLVTVGSLTPQKNQIFLLNVSKYLKKLDIKFKLLIIGDGELRRSLEERIVEDRLDANVVLTGNRTDVQEILQNIGNIFLFPSAFEGLGLAFVEAQHSGLECVISDRVPNEAIFRQDLVATLSLDSYELWGEKIKNILALDYHQKIVEECSPFTIEMSAVNFNKFYDSIALDDE